MTLIKQEYAIKEIESAMETSESIILNAGLACAKGIIASLPSAKADWIPCSERLPAMGDYVLTYRPTLAMRMVVDSYEEYYGEDDNELYEGWAYGGNKVVAWMPLPKPYREEGEK